jgi:hypothetical protein
VQDSGNKGCNFSAVAADVSKYFEEVWSKFTVFAKRRDFVARKATISREPDEISTALLKSCLRKSAQA